MRGAISFPICYNKPKGVREMKLRRETVMDGLLTLVILALAFGVNLLLLMLFDTRTMIPMIFVLGVFLVSWRTQGYFWGVGASLLSVLAVNWAFTYPYSLTKEARIYNGEKTISLTSSAEKTGQ